MSVGSSRDTVLPLLVSFWHMKSPATDKIGRFIVGCARKMMWWPDTRGALNLPDCLLE